MQDILKEMVEKKGKSEITSEFALKIVSDILPTIGDLELRIVDNKTDIAFFSSDALLL